MYFRQERYYTMLFVHYFTSQDLNGDGLARMQDINLCYGNKIMTGNEGENTLYFMIVYSISRFGMLPCKKISERENPNAPLTLSSSSSSNNFLKHAKIRCRQVSE